MSNWNHSVFYYQHDFTDKFDNFINEVNKELNYLEELEDWDRNDKDKHDCLRKIIDIYEECQLTSMWDI